MRIPGIVHKADLALFGIDEPTRRRFLRRGLMERVGSWYVRSIAPPDVVELLRRGVRPTCLSAAPHHGLWTPLHEGRHGYRPRGVPDARQPSDLVLHGRTMRSWPDRDPVASWS